MEDTNPYLSLPEGRKHLAALVRSAGDVIRIDDAARVLGVDRSAAAKALARWVNQGWLRRVAHGAYVSASLGKDATPAAAGVTTGSVAKAA